MLVIDEKQTMIPRRCISRALEEIIRNLKPRTVFLPTPSSWAPVSIQQYKPWLNEQDADEIFFSSINLI